MMNTIRTASPPAGGISAGAPLPDVHPPIVGLVALRGAAGIIFGLLTLYNPLLSLAFLVLLLGAWSLVAGGCAAVAAVANRRNGERWGALLATGLAEILAGIVVLAWPGVAAVAVLGIVRLGIGLRERRGTGSHPTAGAGAP